MANRENARAALATKIEALKATWVAYPLEIEYDNQNRVNLPNQTHPFLCVKLIWMDGYQVDLAEAPLHRVLGAIILEAKTKEGQGSKKGMALLDHFYKPLHMTDANPPLRTQAAQFKSPEPKLGWATDAAIIPFWFDMS